MTASTLAYSRKGQAPFDELAERTSEIGVAVLIIIGFVSSYTTVRDLAVHVGDFPPWLAPVVPLSFDVGIVVLSLRVLLAARTGHPAAVLRLLVLLLSVLTVLVNGIAADTVVGRLLHAVPSAMFIVCFESLITAARSKALGTDTAPSDPRFRRARWLLAPAETWSTWKTHILSDSGFPTVRGNESRTLSAQTASPCAAPSSPQQLRTPGPAAAQSPRRDGSGARDAVALDIVRDLPEITAAELSRQLEQSGHPVSTRTAQRLRERARDALTSDPSAADLAEADTR